jgi:hypothetical protein
VVGNSYSSRSNATSNYPDCSYFAIAMSVFILPTGRMEHVLHLPIVPKINMRMSFRSDNLRHCCYLVIKTHLNINPFMNLISWQAWAPETKSTYDRILPLTHFECSNLKLTKTKYKEITANIYNTIFPSETHNLPFLVSNATPAQWVSINSLIYWEVQASLYCGAYGSAHHIPCCTRITIKIKQILQVELQT